MDREVGGRRTEGEKTETVTVVRKGQQRQRASVREEMKNRRKRWKSMPRLEEELPLWCRGLQSDRLMIKR